MRLDAYSWLKIDEDGQETINAELREQNAKLEKTIKEVRGACTILNYVFLTAAPGQMEAYQTKMEEKLEAQGLEISALNEAVRAYISQPRHPAPPPPPSAAEIIEAVRPPLLAAMHENMKPLLEESHAHVEDLLRKQLTQVNGTLLAQITPTIRAVEVVSSWVDRMQNPPSADAAPSSAPASSS